VNGYQFAGCVAGLAVLLVGAVAGPTRAQFGTLSLPSQEESQAEFAFDSGPLGQIGPGRWQRIQISGTPGGEAVLILDPNRIAWDGYSPSWVSTRMASLRLPVRLKEVKNPDAPKGRPRPSQPIKVYDIVPTKTTAGQSFEAMGLGSGLRLVATAGATGPYRLLLLGPESRPTQVIPLEREKPMAMTPTAGMFDLISLRTGHLGGKMGRASYLKVYGSPESGKLTLETDANAVGLDGYGEPTVATLMMPRVDEVKLVEKTDLDAEAAKSVRVYALEGSPLPALLVLPRGGVGVARLVPLGPDGKPTGFLTLEADYSTAFPLTNADWRLEKIVYNDDKTITPEASGRYNVRFFPDGRVAGQAGVNRLAGTYVITGNQLAFGGLASTRAAALNPGVEADFLKALGQVASYKIQGDELWLKLKLDSGTVILKREKAGR
jgi:heat shock protein HslJ